MRSYGGKKVTSSPKKRIVPEDGGKSPVMQLNSVVLPAPFEPRTARRSPGRTASETPTKEARAPNSRRTPAPFGAERTPAPARPDRERDVDQSGESAEQPRHAAQLEGVGRADRGETLCDAIHGPRRSCVRVARGP